MGCTVTIVFPLWPPHPAVASSSSQIKGAMDSKREAGLREAQEAVRPLGLVAEATRNLQVPCNAASRASQLNTTSSTRLVCSTPPHLSFPYARQELLKLAKCLGLDKAEAGGAIRELLEGLSLVPEQAAAKAEYEAEQQAVQVGEEGQLLVLCGQMARSLQSCRVSTVSNEPFLLAFLSVPSVPSL